MEIRANIIRVLFSLLATVSITFYSMALDVRYYELADSADSAIANEEWQQAESLLLQALRLEPSAPGNIMLISNLSIVQSRMGDIERALGTITQAIDMAPRSLVLLNHRARIYTAAGLDDKALSDYTAMLDINPESEQALFGRGMIYLSSGNLAAAESDLSRLNELKPEARDNHIAQATLFQLRGNYTGAEKHYTALIEMQPTDEYYLGRAVCRIMEGRFSEANEDLSEGVRLNPNNADLYAQLAYLSKLTYRMADYKVYMRRAYELGYKE